MLHSLSNAEIDEYFKNNKQYGGCYSKNELPKIENKFYIINLEDSDAGSGSHWVCCINIEPNICHYFDSYGTPAPIEIQQFMIISQKPKMNTFPYHLQEIGSSACGWYCIFVIECYLKGQTEIEIIKHFSTNTKRNDKVIEQYFKNKNRKVGGNIISDAFTGAYDRAEYLLNKKWQRTPKVKYILQKIGDIKIQMIRICRKPIQSAIRKIGNVLTLGQLNQRVKKLAYDEIFHLFAMIKLENGQVYKLEKNQVVQIHQLPNNFDVDPDTTDWTIVRLTTATTLNQIFENLEKTFPRERIYRYSGFSTNCQRFQMDILISSKAHDIHWLQSFIMQDASKLISEGYLQAMANNVTDFAGNATVAVTGGYIPKLHKNIFW